jgi:hypothetical protein
MTSIKPPQTGLSGPNPLAENTGTSSTGESSFKQALEQAGHTGQTGPVATAGGADPIANLAQQVQGGRMQMDQAVEMLLQQTLERAGTHLSSAQKAELSTLLREALQSDPTLLALRDGHS